MTDPTSPKNTSDQPNRLTDPASDESRPASEPSAPPAAPKPLTPEEQMELYEKDLKENDWGHQPC